MFPWQEQVVHSTARKTSETRDPVPEIGGPQRTQSTDLFRLKFSASDLEAPMRS